MSNSFIENVNYVAKLDNAFGDNISLNKTNISFRGTTANVKFKLSYYDNSLMKILSVETLFNNASYTDLDSILSQFKSNVENIIGVNCNFTLSTNNNAYLVSLVNISLSSSNNDIKFVELKFEMEKDGIELYDVYGKITNPLKILPHLALYDEIFISSIVSIDSYKNELLNINTNISEIVAINDNIEHVISVNNNMNNINTILSNMDTIENVVSSMNEINDINTNIGQIHTVYENIDSILIDANNISNINIVGSDLSGRVLLNRYDAGSIDDPIDTEDLGSSSIVNVSDNINAIININNSIVPNINEILLADNNAIIATTKASEANTSASNAMISETNASASEANALVSETNAFNSSVSALTSASNANSSELIAIAKASEASASATIAIAKASESSLSANSASASALSASESELSALSSSNTATASKDIAVAKANDASISAFNAATSEANSLTYSQNSLASANNSQNSASVSVAKASEASSSATNALASATKSYEWANKAKDLEVEPGLYSAKHWASVAEDFVLSVSALDIPFNGIISGLSAINVQTAIDELDSIVDDKQDLLANQVNIKSINGTSILGSGDLEITVGSEGYAANVYLTTLTSTTNPSYNQISYTPEVTETIISAIVNNNEVLLADYIFDGDVRATAIPAGKWGFHFHARASSSQGTTTIRFEVFKRSSGGIETVLFSKSSTDINNSVFELQSLLFTQPIYTVSETDRIGLKIYANTTMTSNVTVDLAVGNGNAAYFTTPLGIRHNQLRARDDVDSHPISAITGLQYELDNKVKKNANITAGTGTKITYDAKGLVIASTTLSSTDIPSLDTEKLTTGTLPVARGGTGTTTSTGSGSVVLSTSPVLTTPNIGVATGTSFNSITGLASVAPLIAGTAAVGNSTLAARQDHVHPVQTSVSGNAGTATKLETARTIALTGDVTYTSGAFDGSGNVTGTATLANSGVTAGTYKSVTVDSKGRVTGGTNPNTIALYGITDAYTKTEIGAINTDYVAVFNAALV